MKGFMSLMERAGLVTLSDTERGAGETTGEPDPMPVSEPAPAPEVAAMLPAEADGDAAKLIAEDRPLEEIFALAAIPPSPFAAEKLLRLLDGLRAMDLATRKAAVLAMDAADDNWEIADPLIDAQRKIAALDVYKNALAAQVGKAETDTNASIEQIKANLERSVADIRAQIAQLEQLLQREITKASEDTTRIEAALRATREAAARETRRMDKEIERLNEIPATFAQPATSN